MRGPLLRGTGTRLFRSTPDATKAHAAATMPQGSHDIVGILDYILGVDTSRMAGAGKKGKAPGRAKVAPKRRGPEWTSGLKQLYDSVVEEPLPDAFRSLLAKLDDGAK